MHLAERASSKGVFHEFPTHKRTCAQVIILHKSKCVYRALKTARGRCVCVCVLTWTALPMKKQTDTIRSCRKVDNVTLFMVLSSDYVGVVVVPNKRCNERKGCGGRAGLHLRLVAY